MNEEVRRTTPFHQDVVDIATYIGTENPAAAVKFLDAVDAACTTLGRIMDWGSVFSTDKPKLRGVRVVAVPRFSNYLIFYRAANEEVELLRLIHGSRDLDSALSE